MLVARAFKAVFRGVPDRFLSLVTKWLWRWLFVSPEGEVHRSGGAVLADLRAFCFARADQTIFYPDPLIMARRQGRREVFDRIANYLNLDEATVQNLMELDDGI